MTDFAPIVGCMIWEGNYSVKNDPNFRYGAGLKYFDYNFLTPENEKIVVFSDASIPQASSGRFSKVEHKIAWLIESPYLFTAHGLFSSVLDWLIKNRNVFECIGTCDDSLVERYPDKFRFAPFGGIIVPKSETRIYSKTKLCSMSSGSLTQGRAIVYERFKDSGKIDFLGKSFNRPYNSVVEAFAPYMYHISISSSCQNRYFSSNITDAFACGTVPIWRGCSKIGDFFDARGIIIFNDIDELNEILQRIGPEDYYSRIEAINSNLKLVEKYRMPENCLWENILSKIYQDEKACY